jgi:aminoglycoside/choline kinase family phosphotransferase
MRRAVRQAWRAMLPATVDSGRPMIYDYPVDNLILLPDQARRSGIARVRLLDFRMRCARRLPSI